MNKCPHRDNRRRAARLGGRSAHPCVAAPRRRRRGPARRPPRLGRGARRRPASPRCAAAPRPLATPKACRVFSNGCSPWRMAPAPSDGPSRIMPACQASSPTKRARLAAPAVGRGGSATACWIPRPKAFGEAVELDLPRSAVGVHEYLYALSLRHPDAVKCAAALPPLGRARAHRPRALSEPLCPRAGPAGGAATADGSSTRARPTCASSSSSCTSSTRRRPPSWTSCGAPGGPPSTPWPRPGAWGMASRYGSVRNKMVCVRSRMESVIDYLPSSRPRQ